MRAETTLETTFVPSVHGMPFPNTWETVLFDADVAGRQVKLALRGFCGGMSFLALDLHRSGLEAPGEPVGELPERRSPLARYIWRRQIDSLADGLAQNMRGFVKSSYSPRTGPIGSATLTRTRELGNVLVALTAKRPVPLGLIAPNPLRGIGLNHQVVGYGAERSADGLLIRIYDPNIPRRDDVTLFVTWSGDAPIVERRGEQQIAEWRALFVERYAPLEPEIV
jgi:hypothetical protein